MLVNIQLGRKAKTGEEASAIFFLGFSFVVNFFFLLRSIHVAFLDSLPLSTSLGRREKKQIGAPSKWVLSTEFHEVFLCHFSRRIEITRGECLTSRFGEMRARSKHSYFSGWKYRALNGEQTNREQKQSPTKLWGYCIIDPVHPLK